MGLESNRDWPGESSEDSIRIEEETGSDPNFGYFNNCCMCGERFTGHKRRVVCYRCYAKNAIEDVMGAGR